MVMITNLVERKKTKCEQYWPSTGSQDFGPFHVTITHQLILADYTVRTFSVEVLETHKYTLVVRTSFYKLLTQLVHCVLKAKDSIGKICVLST